MLGRILSRIRGIDSVERSAVINTVVKAISVLLSLLYTPLLLGYLLEEKYGLWATLMSIISWINYFDIGIGNGLRNILASDIAVGEHEHARRAVSTAYVVLSAIAAGILAVLVVLTFLIDWHHVFSSQVDMRATLMITFVFICINFVLSIASNMLYALQLAERVAVVSVIIQLINIIGLLILTRTGEGNLVKLAILFGGSTALVNIANTVQIIRKQPFLRPSFRLFQRSCVGEICNMGIMFFLIQIMCLFAFTMDDLMITHFWSPETETPFSVVDKVFLTGYTFFSAFMAPYWSGTTSAIARGDAEWVRKSIRKTIALLGVFAIGCIIVAVIFRPLVYLWLQKELDYEPGIIGVMCLFYILYAALTIECSFINGSGRLKGQFIAYVFVGVLNIPLSILLGVKLGMGTVGIRLATAILIFIVEIPLAFNLRKIINEINDNNSVL